LSSTEGRVIPYDSEKFPFDRATMKDLSVKVYCKTCGLSFLQTTGEKYWRLSTQLHDPSRPDKWFIETGIHYSEHPDHQIVMDWGAKTEDVTLTWKNKFQLDDTIPRIALPHFLEHKQMTAGQPL